jgi:hypothetical protein
MKVVFLTADLGGNIPPTMAVADALARRGVEVEIAGLKPGRTALPHVPFRAATAIKPDGRPQGLREAGAGARLMMSRATSSEAAALIAGRSATPFEGSSPTTSSVHARRPPATSAPSRRARRWPPIGSSRSSTRTVRPHDDDPRARSSCARVTRGPAGGRG